MDNKIIVDNVDVSSCKSFCENYGEYHQGYWEDNEICYLHNNHCSDNPTCYYKQLLAEQAKNKELENQRTVDCEECERNNSKNSSCFECLCIKLNNEQAKNKKLVEALEDCKEIAKTLYITGSDFLPLATYYKDIINTADIALNEVNK